MAHSLQPYLRLEDGRSIYFPENRGESLFLSRRHQFEPDPEARSDTRDGFWIFRAETGLCGVIPTDLEVIVSGKRIPALAVLHHGQVVECQGESLLFQQIFRRPVLTRSAPCPFCKEEFAPEALVIYCPLCLTPYHSECWDSLAEERSHCLVRQCGFVPEKISLLFS